MYTYNIVSNISIVIFLQFIWLAGGMYKKMTQSNVQNQSVNWDAYKNLLITLSNVQNYSIKLLATKKCFESALNCFPNFTSKVASTSA